MAEKQSLLGNGPRPVTTYVTQWIDQKTKKTRNYRTRSLTKYHAMLRARFPNAYTMECDGSIFGFIIKKSKIMREREAKEAEKRGQR